MTIFHWALSLFIFVIVDRLMVFQTGTLGRTVGAEWVVTLVRFLTCMSELMMFQIIFLSESFEAFMECTFELLGSIVMDFHVVF